MGSNLYKLTKIFDDVIGMLILLHHQNVTADKIEGFRGFWLNMSKRVQQIFTKLMSLLGNQQSCIEVFEIKRLGIGHSLLPW